MVLHVAHGGPRRCWLHGGAWPCRVTTCHYGIAVSCNSHQQLCQPQGLGQLRFSLKICSKFLANLVRTFLGAEISSQISPRPEKSICDSNSRASPEILQKQNVALRLCARNFASCEQISRPLGRFQSRSPSVEILLKWRNAVNHRVRQLIVNESFRIRRVSCRSRRIRHHAEKSRTESRIQNSRRATPLLCECGFWIMRMLLA